MSNCEKCGKTTKGYRLCYACHSGKDSKPKSSKAGVVYGLYSKRKSGTTKVYVGQTSRSPRKRWGEHMEEVKKTTSKTWTGKGKSVKGIGAFYSSNRHKAEKTVKAMPRSSKINLFRSAAKKYYKRKYSDD